MENPTMENEVSIAESDIPGLSDQQQRIPLCQKCFAPEDRQENPGLSCEYCNLFIHLTCLASPTPGNFSGDVYFHYFCATCSKTGHEEVVRMKTMTWLNVIYLTMYHLKKTHPGISNRGFFHYKTHIATFIDRNWNNLFGPNFKQKKRWIGTIAGKLSMHSNCYFHSGLQDLGESGWWQLQYKFSPAVVLHIWTEISKGKKSKGSKYVSKNTFEEFLDAVKAFGYEDLAVPQPEYEESLMNEEDVVTQDEDTASVTWPIEFDGEIVTTDAEILPESTNIQIFNAADFEEELADSNDTNNMELLTPIMAQATEETYKKNFNLQPKKIKYKRKISDLPIEDQDDFTYLVPVLPPKVIKPEPMTHDEQPIAVKPDPVTYNYSSDEDLSQEEVKKRERELKQERIERKMDYESRKENLFSEFDNSVGELPFLHKKVMADRRLVEMSVYEEVQLLKQIDGVMAQVGDVNKLCQLRQFRAKLALRRLKRHKRLPVFDLDKSLKVLCGYATESDETKMSSERVLDRFQTSWMVESLSGAIPTAQRGPVLVARDDPGWDRPVAPTRLKPYIRRDAETKPIWLRVQEELLARTVKNNPDFLPTRATIDYSYVRPNHIPAVNRLLSEHFWPGIDVSESLQYPALSCVVTYRRLVVGCAFAVAGGGGAGAEAYVTFVAVRPEWRRAGIATFMIYHLLQTSTGMDVTLHVSPTNPAIFLYQKFGFKVEEFIQDFYEKYYDIDYKGCRHALFLRLVR